jgi:GTP-binding protein EngB required for normal cell division
VTTNTIGVTGLPNVRLPARLASLTELTKIGSGRAGADGFSQELLTEAELLLRRSGERMRMSASHTVVALAGGTGSGKSTLFNALSGANFSPAGVTRPTTKHSHACVWGMEGAGPLLDWLGVQRRHRYARASALDEGESALTGLLLLDLPDHDSVVTGSAALVDRLVKMVDMLVWVLDPLKYADASVHRRYLVPLAGHAAVTLVVLNKVDTLSPDQGADCESDLRRLLDAEGLTETQVLVTSAVTGAGLGDLRRALARSVAARRAATDRIEADVNVLIERFAVYAGGPVPGWQPPEPATAAAPATTGAGAEPPSGAGRPPWERAEDVEHFGNGNGHPVAPDGSPDDDAPATVAEWQPWQTTVAPTRPSSTARPPWADATRDDDGTGQPAEDPAGYIPAGPAGTLTAAFAKAAGVSAAAETLNGVRERNAAGYIGWPPARLVARLVARLRGQPPARKVLAGEPADVVQAQRSDIDNAVTVFASEVGGSLPEPWPRTVLAAARSRADEAQAALGAAVTQGLPRRDKVTGWWRLIALAQWLLMTLVLVGLVWIVLILALGGSHSAHKPPSLINDVSLASWLGVMVVALLLLGWLISSWCQNMVVLAADRERQLAVHAILARVSVVASELVLVPVGRELADYEGFRAHLAAARDSAPVDLRRCRRPQVVGPVDAGPQVFARGDARERPELTGEVRLVGVAVPGGRVRPVDTALPVQVPNESLHPLHSREALGGKAHLRRESPPQGPRQHPEIVGYLPDRDAAGQCAGRGDHRPIERQSAGQLLEQDIFHHRERTLGCAGLDQPLPQACP